MLVAVLDLPHLSVETVEREQFVVAKLDTSYNLVPEVKILTVHTPRRFRPS